MQLEIQVQRREEEETKVYYDSSYSVKGKGPIEEFMMSHSFTRIFPISVWGQRTSFTVQRKEQLRQLANDPLPLATTATMMHSIVSKRVCGDYHLRMCVHFCNTTRMADCRARIPFLKKAASFLSHLQMMMRKTVRLTPWIWSLSAPVPVITANLLCGLGKFRKIATISSYRRASGFIK